MSYQQQRDDYLSAVAWVGELMGSTSPSQMNSPTPCAEYDVRTLMGHLIGTAERGLGTAERRSTQHVPHVVIGIPDGELAAAYKQLAERIGAAWVRLPEGEWVRAPWGECSALEAARGFTVETVVHGWDLAVATGQASEAPGGIAARCLPVTEAVVPQRLRGVMYDEPAAAAPAAKATEKLAHQLGHRRQ